MQLPLQRCARDSLTFETKDMQDALYLFFAKAAVLCGSLGSITKAPATILLDNIRALSMLEVTIVVLSY